MRSGKFKFELEVYNLINLIAIPSIMTKLRQQSKAAAILLAPLLILSFSTFVQAKILPVFQTCSDTMYFNTAIYSCQNCGTNAIQNKTTGKSSVCAFFFNLTDLVLNFRCLLPMSGRLHKVLSHC